MRSGALPLLGWGAALVAIAALGALGFGLDALPALLLAGAGAACAVTAGAVALAAGHERGAAAADVELVLRSSAATLVLTVGATLALVGGLVVGPALLWPGAGFVALGGAGIVREQRAARRLLAGAGAAGHRERGG
jgi:hypothetical protein